MIIYLILCIRIQYYFIYLFLFKLFQLWPLWDLLVGSCVPLTYTHHCGMCAYICVCVFPSLPYFLAWEDAQSSSYIFPAPVLELATFKGVWFLLMKNQIRNQDLETKYAYCYQGSVASRSLNWQSKEILLYINPCINI